MPEETFSPNQLFAQDPHGSRQPFSEQGLENLQRLHADSNTKGWKYGTASEIDALMESQPTTVINPKVNEMLTAKDKEIAELKKQLAKANTAPAPAGNTIVLAKDMKGIDAIEKMKGFKTAAEVNEFVEGDSRATVIQASMDTIAAIG